MSLLIQNCRRENRKIDLLIENGQIESVGEVDKSATEPDRTIAADGQLVFPALLNGHTHAAMTLFRGYGDDMPLQSWLEEKIWPAEERLTAEDVYWGTRLACLEMIKSGTCFFNDMYWQPEATMQAVEAAGIKAEVSGVFIDEFDPETAEEFKQKNIELHEKSEEYSDRIQFALGPHAIYTVSPESLQWIADYSREHELPVHIHLAETEYEVEECRHQHGAAPVNYLDQLGFLHSNVVVAHGLWLTDEEIEILGERGASVVYNPLSNLKLAAGANFKYTRLKEAGVKVCPGTDGAASNNSLNLWEEIKMVALLQKNRQEDPTVLPAEETLELATEQAAEVFDLESGRLEPGMSADLVLIDTQHPALQPDFEPNSLLAYALPQEAITTTICNGKILMEDRQVEGAAEVKVKARERAEKFRDA